jgi:metal-sulfur cluster biosynthetic enzyme
MKYAGVSELEAIREATCDAGVVLGLEGEVGAVAPGMLADLLVVDGDPRKDITVLQESARIETIVLDGEIVEVDRDLDSWPNLPSYSYASRYLTQEAAKAATGERGRRQRRRSRRADRLAAARRARQSDRRMSVHGTDMADVERVREALHEVIDPELGINVVDLGMIREIHRDDGRTVVYMVLTTMTCPFWGLFVDQVKMALAEVEGVGEVDVRFDPRHRWTPDLISDEARWELEIQGLLPTSGWLR